MRWLLLASLLLAPRQEFKFNEWESWNTFNEGSSVSFELEASGVKMTMTSTLGKKEAEKLTLSSEVDMGGNKMPGQDREIKKPKEGESTELKCDKCKDHKKPKITESKEKLKVGDKEVECTLQDTVVYDCEGNESGTAKVWYSKEVPGWMVKMEAKFSGQETKLVCSGFTKK